MKIAEKVESDWGETDKLLKKAIDQGLIRNVPIELIKLMVEGAIEKFLSSEDFARSQYSYEESLNMMINVLINGIKA